MTQLPETTEFAQQRLALSDEQLALDSLGRNISDAEAEVKNAESSLRFTRGYKPTPPGPRPHPEAGGMDHQDWEVDRLEYAQYDEDAENDSAENRFYDAQCKLDDLLGLKSGAEQGDEEVIADVAGSERSRLLEVIARAGRAEERKAGKEFEGGKDLYQAIAALQGDADKLKAATEKTGTNGWQRASYRPTWTDKGSVFRVNPEEGPLKSFDSYTKLLEVAAGEEKVSIKYSEMPEDGLVTWLNSDWRGTPVNYYVLTLDKNGIATNQTHRRGEATQQHYIGSKYSSIFQPIHNYEGVRELDFTQADIDKLRDIVTGVAADVNELSN